MQVSPLAWQLACDEERFFRARSKAINLASYTVLAAAVVVLAQCNGPLPIVATLVGCGVVASSWMRTDGQTNVIEGFNKLAQGDNAGAEAAFCYACDENVGRLGLAEARRRQGKWAEAAYALLRVKDAELRHRRVVSDQLSAIEARDAEPQRNCHRWL